MVSIWGTGGHGAEGQSSTTRVFFFFPLRNVKVTWTLTSLSHDGRVLPQHGRRRLRQRDDHLQRQLPLHVGQVGVGAQLERDG